MHNASMYTVDFVEIHVPIHDLSMWRIMSFFAVLSALKLG